MNSITEKYKKIYKKVEDINAQIDRKTAEKEQLIADGKSHFPARIENLEATIEKIDDYLLRVKGFQELAKKNLESTNVLTIEAPPGYRVNLNRLRNWSMLIDPTSPNDPYAQRVFIVAKCDECFLEQKKTEFTNKLEALKHADEHAVTDELTKIEAEIDALVKELETMSAGSDITAFIDEVIAANNKYWITDSVKTYPNNDTCDAFAPGAMMLPFKLHPKDLTTLKSQLGQFYEEKNKRILIPFEIPLNKDFVINITSSPSRTKQLDRGIQNLILNYILNNKPGQSKVYIIDSARYNSSSLGALRNIEDTIVIDKIPRNPEQLTDLLRTTVSKFSDVDDLIDLYDSIREYNENLTDKSGVLPTSLIVLYGWPNSFSQEDRELIKKVMANYERYGVSCITVSFAVTDEDFKRVKDSLPEYAANNAISIRMTAKETTITEPEKSPRNFVWYTFSQNLEEKFIDDVKSFKVKSNKKGNEYTTWFSMDKKELAPYTREYKPISLPFGMDAKENVHEISFENENFAAYLVGASRSGKSTLLHTLIAGIIRNYHPDNVELWLADFKQLEFKRYIKHCPPHVKYVLLDESPELVYDLVDKLTDEMLERQKLFSRLGKQRIDQVDTTKLDKPLPVIFVILDEFSIMSQSIAESDIYKLKLQNLLAKGAALGIKFLFSSQTFTTGVGGLTSTARAQIQQRISMKGAREEISATLELSSNLKTEQVKNWMDALPPHYALVKYRVGPDTSPQVKRFLVMYFKDYAIRDELIDSLNADMKKVDTYQPSEQRTYTDKHPVLVDGNTFDLFDENDLLSLHNGDSTDSLIKQKADEIYVSFGTPRLMSRIKWTVLSNETRENILLVARAIENHCATSIMLSTIKSFILQGGNVEVWAYSKNTLYKNYKHLFEELDIKIVEDIDAICDAIQKTKENISSKTTDKKIVVLVGMERICMDFDLVDNTQLSPSSNSEKSTQIVKQAGVQTDKENIMHGYAMAWVKKRIPLKKKLVSEGKSEQEIAEALSEAEREFKKAYYESNGISYDEINSATLAKKSDNETKPEIMSKTVEKDNIGAYNAQNDFIYILKQGSRLGYHFMLYINDYSDIKQCGLKNPDLFRYRLSFQLPVEESRNLFNNKSASVLPEHICKYDNRLEQYSFRPYLHKGIGWDGWYVDENNQVYNPYSEIDN